MPRFALSPGRKSSPRTRTRARVVQVHPLDVLRHLGAVGGHHLSRGMKKSLQTGALCTLRITSSQPRAPTLSHRGRMMFLSATPTHTSISQESHPPKFSMSFCAFHRLGSVGCMRGPTFSIESSSTLQRTYRYVMAFLRCVGRGSFAPKLVRDAIESRNEQRLPEPLSSGCGGWGPENRTGAQKSQPRDASCGEGGAPRKIGRSRSTTNGEKKGLKGFEKNLTKSFLESLRIF